MTQQAASHPTPYVLALDVGTSSTRAIICDATGAPVPGWAAQQTYSPLTGEDGASTFESGTLLAATATVIDQALAAAGDGARQICAVGMDTFWHSLLAVDGTNVPLTQVITWADTRPRTAAHDLRARLDVNAIHQRTGATLHASYWPAKLAWLRATQPEVFAQAAQFISIGEWLHRQFLGKSICALSMASGTGLLATQARAWDGDLAKQLGVRGEQLPALGDLGDSVTGLQPDYARRWPALAAIPWYPALGDGATANIGSDCATAERLALTIGTSSAMRAIVPLDEREIPPGLWRYLLDRDRAVLGGALSEGGNLLAWLASTCKLPSLADAEAQATQLAPAAHGLDILPFIAGERSLGWHDDARLVISGITGETTSIELLRGMLEALALRLGALHTRLTQAMPELAQAHIIGSGGTLLRAPLLQQMLADVLGMPLALSTVDEASARGAAILALQALGALPAGEAAKPPISTITPAPAHAATYQAAAQRQAKLYAALLGDT
jgi:gluconokinase